VKDDSFVESRQFAEAVLKLDGLNISTQMPDHFVAWVVKFNFKTEEQEIRDQYGHKQKLPGREQIHLDAYMIEPISARLEIICDARAYLPETFNIITIPDKPIKELQSQGYTYIKWTAYGVVPDKETGLAVLFRRKYGHFPFRISDQACFMGCFLRSLKFLDSEAHQAVP